MSDLTVRSDTKIVTQGSSLIISTQHAVSILCTRCGNTKNVYLHYDPTHDDMQPDAKLRTGLEGNAMFQQCLCLGGTQMSDTMRVLAEVADAIARASSLEAAKRAVQEAASRLEVQGVQA